MNLIRFTQILQFEIEKKQYQNNNFGNRKDGLNMIKSFLLVTNEKSGC